MELLAGHYKIYITNDCEREDRLGEDVSKFVSNNKVNAIQLSIISVVFCHREPLFFMPKNFKKKKKNS